MTRRARPEQQIQKAVLEHLRVRGAPNLFAFHCPNGGGRSAIEGAILKGMGVRAGVPDLLIVHDGRLFGLELKTDAGRISTAQVETLQRMQAAGAIVAVAHGLDHALDWLEANGLLRGKAA